MDAQLCLGYNTNGFAHHRIEDAIEVLAEIGYQSVAITLDHDHFDPPDRHGVPRCVKRLEPVLQRTALRATIETGARFILDPQRKHQPTLISSRAEDRNRRLEFLRAAVDIAAALSAESVSFWSGRADDDAPRDELVERLVVSIRALCDHASTRSVRLAFEPEPGMLIETMEQFDQLQRLVGHPLFGLTLDIGHVHCLDDGDASEHIRTWRDSLWNLHVEDMRRGHHEHLTFGNGEIEFSRILAQLRAINYAGPIHVELPRQAHDAVTTATQAFEFLTTRCLDRSD